MKGLRLRAQTSLKKVSEALAQKDYNKVSAIVGFMEKHGEITPKEAETVTGKSAATVRRYFKLLTGTRYIVAEGSTNNMVYGRMRYAAGHLPGRIIFRKHFRNFSKKERLSSFIIIWYNVITVKENRRCLYRGKIWGKV